MFDMPDGLEINEPELHKISEDLEVTISIKPKHRQGNKSVLIKAQERNASAIYEARHKLLKIEAIWLKMVGNLCALSLVQIVEQIRCWIYNFKS